MPEPEGKISFYDLKKKEHHNVWARNCDLWKTDRGYAVTHTLPDGRRLYQAIGITRLNDMGFKIGNLPKYVIDAKYEKSRARAHSRAVERAAVRKEERAMMRMNAPEKVKRAITDDERKKRNAAAKRRRDLKKGDATLDKLIG